MGEEDVLGENLIDVGKGGHLGREDLPMMCFHAVLAFCDDA